MRIASPMITYPCFYGVDTSTRQELIAAHKSVQELCDYIHADSLRFLSVEELRSICKGGLCTACFDGQYVTELYDYAEKLNE